MGEWLWLDKAQDRALAWLARKGIGRLLSFGLAWALRRLVVDVDDAPHKVMESHPSHQYRIIQLWLRNAIHRDAYHVTAQATWTRDGAQENVRTMPGRWFHVKAPGMADMSLGGKDEADLLSSGNVEHLGVVVKYTADRDAYIVTPASHVRRMSGQDWRDPAAAVTPGSYTVVVRLQSWGGYRAKLVLRVVNPGKDAILNYRVLSPRSIAEI